MRRGVMAWMVGAFLLAGVVGAAASEGQLLSDGELDAEISRNGALAAYVARNGFPDVAERHFLSDRPPWDKHEVTLYYLDRRKEISFARAWILGRPTIALERFERPLTDADVAALEQIARRRMRSNLGPAGKAEAAARRAEVAASHIGDAAEAAELAAGRAEAVAAKMESSFHRALKK